MLKRYLFQFVAVVVITAVSLAASAAFAQTRYQLDLPAQPLGDTLRAIGRVTGTNILFEPLVVAGKTAKAIAGQFTVDEALGQAVSGTSLEIEHSGDNTVLIKERGAKAEVPSAPRIEQAEKITALEITGSRLARTEVEGPQDVLIYNREQIDRSGQTTVADFLNTLPSVSVNFSENGFQSANGATTVQLRGLPTGTTLVLINGRRIQASGQTSFGGLDVFNLNNIPLGAVERIEVLPTGSSAIYGSDAIAGVVNIILKKNFNGFDATATYGHTNGADESNFIVGWGKQWEKGSFSIFGSYQQRSELDLSERRLTASNDYTAYGGPNNNLPTCHPGNVFSVDGVTPLPGAPPGSTATYAAVTGNQTGKPTFGNFTYGALNSCNLNASDSLIPATNRKGVFAQGNYEISQSAEVFAELLYTHVKQYQYGSPPLLFGEQGFQQYTVGPSNPYNPFGTTVGIGDILSSLPRAGIIGDTYFVRPLIGVRGSLLDDWDWEITARESKDKTNISLVHGVTDSAAIQNALNSSDPTMALNPFIAGPQGTSALLNSFFSDGLITMTAREPAVEAFVRGTVFRLPSGPIKIVVGGEYERDSMSSLIANDGQGDINVQAHSQRTHEAVYLEARVPIVGKPSDERKTDVLVATLADRYDHYSDFGGTTNPQYGLEWRPLDSLLFRGSYAQAFKAPSLFELYRPQQSNPSLLTDPLTGLPVNVTLISGGNPALRPQTGDSSSLGLVYSSKAIPGLQVSITNWNVKLSNAIETVDPQFQIDNPNLFPGTVIRASSCTGGPPCPITTVFNTFVNYGSIDVKGFDYQVEYKITTRFGDLTPSVSASQTYKYQASLGPTSPVTDRVSKANDDGNWAPRWKIVPALAWKYGSYTASIDGRYVSRYQDYDTTRMIGDFWLYDANLRVALGQVLGSGDQWLKGAYAEIGGVNLLNTLPQYSNFSGSFLGYDPTQGDIRGRFLYLRLGLHY